jgi:hypothetical protein
MLIHFTTGHTLMKLIKKTVHSMPAFVKLIVELTKEGKEINLSHTRASYGLSYLVAYTETPEQVESAEEIIVEDVVVDQATIEAEQAIEESVEDTPSEDVASDLEQEAVVFEAEASDDIPMPEVDVLEGKTLAELRVICTEKNIKYAPAAKEAKLIELIKAAE